MTTLRRAAVLCLTGMLAACAGGGEPPPDHYYRLDVPVAVEPLPRPLFPGTIEVAPLMADGLVSDRAVVYLYANQPDEIHQYTYHFWNTPPATLVQQQLIQVLRRAGAARHVVSTDLRLPADASIEGRVRRFEQVFDGSAVRVVIDLELAVVRAKDEGVVLLKEYRAERPAGDDSLRAATTAASEALGDIFTRFLADIRSARAAS